MADAIASIELKGDRDIVAAFKDLREYLPANAIRTATRQAAQALAQKISLLAPKLTGKLVRNIVVKTKKTDKTVRARVVVNTIGKADNNQNAFYWRFLEEGFHTRKGDFRKFPFVITAFNALKEQSAQLVIDSVDKAIDRAEAKAKRANL